MNSMTGYGRISTQINQVSIDISIKTVNHRYLDIRSHLPKKYYYLEDKINKLAQQHILRGTCDIYIQRTPMGESQAEKHFYFQVGLAEDWLKSYRQTLKKLKIADTISSQDLLTIPDFVSWQETTSISSKEEAALLSTLKKAFAQLQKERSREGEFLKKTCEKHLKDLTKKVTDLQSMREIFVKEAAQRFQDRLAKLKLEVDANRLAQEVAILVDRTDIEEELSRLGEHIKSVKAMVGSKEATGKKLDFYAQELLREINTIGSKSQSAKITEVVVDAKSLIEQLREQIQNIE